MTKEKRAKVEKGVNAGSDKLVFGKMNYILMAAGIVILIIGFLMMSGGGSDDPNVFDEGIFSFRRITLAPIIVLIGFVVEGVAIMYRPGNKKKETA